MAGLLGAAAAGRLLCAQPPLPSPTRSPIRLLAPEFDSGNEQVSAPPTLGASPLRRMQQRAAAESARSQAGVPSIAPPQRPQHLDDLLSTPHQRSLLAGPQPTLLQTTAAQLPALPAPEPLHADRGELLGPEPEPEAPLQQAMPPAPFPAPDGALQRQPLPSPCPPPGSQSPAAPSREREPPQRQFTSHVPLNAAQNARDGSARLAPYFGRAQAAPVVEPKPLLDEQLTRLPAGFRPWWEEPMPQALRESGEQLPVSVDLLVTGALEFAPQISAIRYDPGIRYAGFLEENAAFDWTAFVETRWDDLNDPVGSTLTTGTASDRFENQIWSGSAGVRRKNEVGGKFEVAQKFGYEDQNSTFFVPAPQGTARLELNYTQPLLNGRGEAYNRSRIVLAGIDTNLANDRVAAELQDHLLAVTEAYWDLFRSRALFLQNQKLLLSAIEIESLLSARQGVDAQERQVLRARAAVAGRRAEILRAAASIRNAESRLRLLVGDPAIMDVGYLELIPEEAPLSHHIPLSMTGSLQAALLHRPDISQTIRQLRAASVRAGVAENELLPRLDLVLRTYVAGLEGNADMPQAWGDQFTRGRPGYSVGFLFEVPLGNRAAQARLQKRQLEYSRAVAEFRTAVETALTEVELAVRDAETSYQEMLSRFQALEAAELEAEYLDSRWRMALGGERSTTLLLEDLLDAQERLAIAEADFVQSQVGYVIALARVRRATGTLLHVELGAAASPPHCPPVAAGGPSTQTRQQREAVWNQQLHARRHGGAVQASHSDPHAQTSQAMPSSFEISPPKLSLEQY
jgi:outer membrane protein TolC